MKCFKEFLVSNNIELRGAIMLAWASFLAIFEEMFEGATPDQLPRPPEPLTEEFKKRREKAARVSLLHAEDCCEHDLSYVVTINRQSARD